MFLRYKNALIDGWRRPILGRLQAFFLCFLSLFSAAGAALAQPAPTAPASTPSGDFIAVPAVGRVVDKANLLDAATAARINQSVQAFEAAKGAQIAVLIVPTTQPEAIFDFSIRVAEAWKLGRKGVDDGVLFVIAKDDRKMQILTGAGTQGVLTDAMSKRIIAETVAPKFRSGNFGGGIEDVVAQIISVVSGEALPPPKARSDKRSVNSGGGNDFQSLFFVVLFVAIFVFRILRAMIGRFFASGVTAGLIGVGASLFGASLLIAVGVGVLVFVAAFIFGAASSSGRRGGSSSGWGWSTGGGSWGGSSGSSGGDSFSGGGGGFDGGGASGDW